MTMVSSFIRTVYKVDYNLRLRYVLNCQVTTAFTWIHNVLSKNTHTHTLTMKNQFDSPSFCVAWWYLVSPTLYRRWAIISALIMDETGSQTSTQTHIHSYASVRTQQHTVLWVEICPIDRDKNKVFVYDYGKFAVSAEYLRATVNVNADRCWMANQ